LNNKKYRSDAELALRIKFGEQEAYQELFERYAPKIYHFSFTYLKSKVDAEELVQDVFLKIWDKREILDATQNVKAYIYKIAINTIYDFIRRKNADNKFNNDARVNFNSASNNTWDTIVYKEMQSTLSEVVALMPEQRRRVFLLSKEEGLSNDEIALKLELSKRTVENQLYRSIGFLKEQLKNHFAFALLLIYILGGL
jgi:RNA polymerase sigma-70 factor (ECF subfamily)